MTYLLCVHLYHCTPRELDLNDAHTVLLHWEFYVQEQKYKAREAKRKRKARRGGGMGKSGLEKGSSDSED